MKKMILLFSHKLSETQILEAKKSLGVDSFIYLPTHLQNIWSNISPIAPSIITLIDPIKKFIVENSSQGDIILIQGDFGVSYNLVNFALKNRYIPVYATTQRLVTQYEKDGQIIKKSTFEFGRFRQYE